VIADLGEDEGEDALAIARVQRFERPVITRAGGSDQAAVIRDGRQGTGLQRQFHLTPAFGRIWLPPPAATGAFH
jgi:hypothetical protein